MTKILNKYEKNLIKLATFLRNNVKQESFDMLNYRSYRNHKNIITRKNYEDIFSCGTIACALGHGPRIKGLLPRPEDFIGKLLIGIDTLKINSLLMLVNKTKVSGASHQHGHQKTTLQKEQLKELKY